MRTLSLMSAAAAAFLIGLCSADASRAQTLWSGASVGMTVAQAREAFPAAVSLLDRANRIAGSVERLRVGITIEGRPATLRLYFRSGRLELVEANVDGEKPGVVDRSFVDARKRNMDEWMHGSGKCDETDHASFYGVTCKWRNRRVAAIFVGDASYAAGMTDEVVYDARIPASALKPTGTAERPISAPPHQ